jgi:hypothetical protein
MTQLNVIAIPYSKEFIAYLLEREAEMERLLSLLLEDKNDQKQSNKS